MKNKTLKGGKLMRKKVMKWCPYCQTISQCRPHGHDAKKRQRWICTSCGRVFTEGVTNRRPKPIRRFIVNCPHCGKATRCVKHGKKVNPSDGKQRYEWLCLECGKYFSTVDENWQEEPIRIVETTHVCPECRSIIIPREWYCPECNKTYRQEQDGRISPIENEDKAIAKKKSLFRKILSIFKFGQYF